MLIKFKFEEGISFAEFLQVIKTIIELNMDTKVNETVKIQNIGANYKEETENITEELIKYVEFNKETQVITFKWRDE